eukprot:GHVL01027836.1.p1 GENE.GHVL01027836.1~~GHVL01027836.1.p1  ORF type:complete len:600 (+),score=150.84 GHVL01027836.1:152-1951(+)
MSYKRSMGDRNDETRTLIDYKNAVTSLEKQYQRADSKLQEVLSELKKSRQTQEVATRDLKNCQRLSDRLSSDKKDLEHQVISSKGAIRKLEGRLAVALKALEKKEPNESLGQQLEKMQLNASASAQLITELEHERHIIKRDAENNAASNIEFLQSELTKMKIELREEQSQNERLRSEMEVISNDYVKHQQELMSEQSIISNLRDEIIHHRSTSESLQNKIRGIGEECDTLRRCLENTQIQVNERDDKIKDLMDENRQLRKEEGSILQNQKNNEREWRDIISQKDREIMRLSDDKRGVLNELHENKLKCSNIENKSLESDKVIEQLAVQAAKMTSECSNAASVAEKKDEIIRKLNSTIEEGEIEINRLKNHLKRQELAYEQSERDAAASRAELKRKELACAQSIRDAAASSAEATAKGRLLETIESELVKVKAEKMQLAKAAGEAVERCASSVLEQPMIAQRLDHRMAHIEALKKSLMNSALSSQVIASRLHKETSPQIKEKNSPSCGHTSSSKGPPFPQKNIQKNIYKNNDFHNKNIDDFNNQNNIYKINNQKNNIYKSNSVSGEFTYIGKGASREGALRVSYEELIEATRTLKMLKQT